MKRNKNDSPAGNVDGIRRVIDDNGRYAFFLESLHAEYATEQNCGLRQIGGLSGLGTVTYSVGMRKGEMFW